MPSGILLFLARHKGSYTNVVAALSGTLAQLNLTGLHTLIAVAELPAAATPSDSPIPNVSLGSVRNFCLSLARA